MKYVLAIAIIVLSTLLSQCSDSGTNPEDNLKPGRRDYLWEIDTLNTYNGLVGYSEIWGANPNDMWLVGQGTNNTESILRYDGNSWRVANDGQYIKCNSIFGFSENNIWIGGDEGKIYHYDGTSIQLFQTIKHEGYNSFGFYSIDGNLPNNIIAVGALDWETGAIARFDGASWRIEYVADFPCQFSGVEIKSLNEYYIFSYLFESEFDGGIYIFEKNELKEFRIGQFKNNSVPIIDRIGDEIFFAWGKKIYQYSDNEFKLFLDLSYLGDVIPKIWGRNRKDFFLIKNNRLYHYNGNDIQLLLMTYENDILDIRDAVLFEDEVFMLVLNHNNSQRYVYHGKQK